MYLTSGVALGAMVLTFMAITIVARVTKQNIPLAINLFVCMIVGALASGFGVPLRHLFEGPVWYIYINLVIFTGMIFLTCLKAAGNLDCIAYDILTKFRKRPSIMFCLITLLLFFPGMVTGVGTAGVLSTGLVAIVILRAVGIPNIQTGAIVAMVTTIGAAAPPVNLPAIIIASGINMPYEGFDLILLVITLPLGIFTIFWLGYKHFKSPTLEEIETILPRPERKNFIMPYVPLIVVVTIFILIRAMPGKFPDIITPMVFMVGSLSTLFTGKKYSFVEAGKEAVRGGIFSTVALIFVVGTVVQVTTLTGSKGLLVLAAMTIGAISPILLYAVLGVSLPLLGGVLTHLGASVILGIPFTLAMLTQNVIAVVAGLSMLCVLAQVIPPSALGGYFAQELVKEPKYGTILKASLVPLIVCIVFSIIVLIFANRFAALFVPY
jgi:TRAP-type C4-dicarboxylate transport system permease large subunit